jgi:hypothetical protein
MADLKQREGRVKSGTRQSPQEHTPSDQLSPPISLLLNFTEPPKAVPPGPSTEHTDLWGTFNI